MTLLNNWPNNTLNSVFYTAFTTLYIGQSPFDTDVEDKKILFTIIQQ